VYKFAVWTSALSRKDYGNVSGRVDSHLGWVKGTCSDAIAHPSDGGPVVVRSRG
jgi:hypothetical protein